MGELTEFWLLNNPSHCRHLLSQVRVTVNGVADQPLTEFTTEAGEVVQLADATDAQVLAVAEFIANALETMSKES